MRERIVTLLLLSYYCSLCSSLSCYQCSGNGQLCSDPADPGDEVDCPTVSSLMQPSLETMLANGWTTLPKVPSRNDLLGLVSSIFSVLPTNIIQPFMRAAQPLILANSSFSDIQVTLNQVLQNMTVNSTDNICTYRFVKGLDNTTSYYRGCFFTHQLGLADWLWVQSNLTRMLSPRTDQCVGNYTLATCSRQYCSKPLCNDQGLYKCMQCGGGESICGEGDLGVPTACPSDFTYCIKEATGDSSNREIYARYCGSKLDQYQVCGKDSSLSTAANGQGFCCSNRDQQLCNSCRVTTLSRLLLALLLGLAGTYIKSAL